MTEEQIKFICKQAIEHGNKPLTDIQKELLKQALTDKVNDREVYMKGIDNSYLYEGYISFRTEEL